MKFNFKGSEVKHSPSASHSCFPVQGFAPEIPSQIILLSLLKIASTQFKKLLDDLRVPFAERIILFACLHLEH